MAKRQRKPRDYRAEYAARKISNAAKGFRSPREATKLRRAARDIGVPNSRKLTAAELRNQTRYIAEARSRTAEMQERGMWRGIMGFNESKADDPEYVNTFHRWLSLDGSSSEEERRSAVIDLWEANLGLDHDDLADFYDDGGSIPE